MTEEEIVLLAGSDMRQQIEHNLGRDPADVALDKRLPHARLVATQISNLRRASAKLPSFYAARCILPTRASEQSSAEVVAAVRDRSGELCIDLTCGLGVDAFAFSKRFRKVVAVEADPALARAARFNFGLLGADNIEAVCGRAEDYVAEALKQGIEADLIYIDPDRRDGRGKRLYDPAACSPDITGLLPSLKSMAKRVMIKLSPMFDPDEAFRIFGPDCLVTLVSAAGECKELRAELGEGITGQSVAATAVGKTPEGDNTVRSTTSPYPIPKPPECDFSSPYGFFAVPDAALRGTRLTAAHLDELGLGPREAYLSAPSGNALLRRKPEGFIGRVFEISSMRPYRPQQLKKELSARRVRSAEIFAAGIPGGAPAAFRRLGLKDGGPFRLALVRIDGDVWVIELENLYL